MKKYIGLVFILLSIIALGQNKSEIIKSLKNIESEEKAEKFILDNPNWKIELIELSDLDPDSPKEIITLKKGKSKIIESNGVKSHYKLLSKGRETEYRVSYIYLNGGEMNAEQIDSIRPMIIEKYKSGTSFEELVEDYNMDGNSKKGDLGWFKSGAMVPDFEKAVKGHVKNDIFLVNVDSKKWYYVVLKTYEDRVNNTLKLIRIKEQ